MYWFLYFKGKPKEETTEGPTNKTFQVKFQGLDLLYTVEAPLWDWQSINFSSIDF